MGQGWDHEPPPTSAHADRAGRVSGVPPMVARASVIIPAHEEERAVRATVYALLESAQAAEYQVIVVANGCTDATADVARSAGAELGLPVQAVEIPEASKTAALNAGDQIATAFPRVYLDADVTCPTSTLLSMVTALHQEGVDLAVATRRLDLEHASWWVRRYYRAWSALPRVRSELSGRGAYAFSRAGRARFEAFPEIVADDSWAVRQVPRDRAVVVPEEIVIRPPLDLASLVRVRSRIYAGNRAAGIPANRGTSGLSDVMFLMKRPRHWWAAAIFIGTNAYIKAIGVRRHSTGRDRVRGSLQEPSISPSGEGS